MSEHAVRIDGLRFRYPGALIGHDQQAWTVAVDAFELSAGDHVLLAGGSGRGKSTLLQLIAGLLEPQRGTIEVAGQDLRALRGAARDTFRGRTVGMIFQTFNLLHGFSALENVLTALMFSQIDRREHESRAAALLDQLGIERHAAAVDELSIGQQQRVAVARAVACEPALVLADEPTASLDPDNGAAAMELIREVCREQGAALICTSHDPTMRTQFERIEELGELMPSSAVGAASGGAR